MRILGRGKTALSIKERYPSASIYDDTNKDEYDNESEDITVVSPGMPPHNELVFNTKNLISEYDLFSDEMPFSVWISGTNGKTTTTQMLQHLLFDYDSQSGGNIGFPLASMDKLKKIWLLETSSFTLHYTNIAKPNIYVLLSVTEDHLSWHGTFEAYEQAKLKPLQNMSETDIAILPSKFKHYKTKAKTFYYESIDDLRKEFQIKSSEINFKEPFLIDAALALVVAKIITKKIDYDKINTFTTDFHKLEEFKDSKNRIWINDSKATNCAATIEALKTYKNKNIFLILGGDDKGMDLTPLFVELKNYNIKLFLIGQNMMLLSNLAQKYNINAVKIKTLELAVKKISSIYRTNENSIAMLSPSAASFDQFSSYIDRGEKFKEFVNSLKL